MQRSFREMMTSNRFSLFRCVAWSLKIGLILAGLSVARDALAQAPDTEIEMNLIYRRVDDGPLRLDLMVPSEGEGPYPVVIVIHEGAWRRGDKIENRPIMFKLAQKGYATVSPQYRFAPENPFPAALHDLKDVVRWVKANAKARLLDGNHIGVYGHTAGGHLALMLGATSEEDGLEGTKPIAAGQPDSRVQAVVSYFSPTDLGADDLSPTSQHYITDFLGGSPADKPKLARRASPITYISKGDPPILAFHNLHNRDIPFTQAEKLKKAIEQAAIPGQIETLPDYIRGTREIEEAKTDKLVFDFFDTHLKVK